MKQHTGEMIERIRQGERLLLTHRGSPIALISPINQEDLQRLIEREAERAETLAWLQASEAAFAFWDNDRDALWDQVEVS